MAGGMEGPAGDPSRRKLHQLLDPSHHFPCRFVGKGQEQDLPWRDSVLNRAGWFGRQGYGSCRCRRPQAPTSARRGA